MLHPADHATLDDRTVAYVAATSRAFEDLRQVASQLAGLLVLAASGARSATPHHPMLDLAVRLRDEADDAVRSAQPTERARPHHHRLLRAAAALRVALTAAREGLAGHGPVDIDPMLNPLRAGYDELRQASGLLPGFELIAFDQACCGVGSKAGWNGGRNELDPEHERQGGRTDRIGRQDRQGE